MDVTKITPQLFGTITVVGAIVYLLFKRPLHHEVTDWRSSQPIVGLRKQWFGWSRAVLRSASLSKEWAFEGYQKHSKMNSPFIIPSLDRGPVVVVPPQQLKKVYNHPTSVLDVYVTQNDTIQTKYTVADQDIIQNSFQIGVIRHQMTRNLEHLTPFIAEELKTGFEEWWGTDDEEWRELRIWDSCLKLIAGAANGAFCGPPLCRDSAFLASLRDHAMTMFVGSMIINATPSLLKPITGHIVGWLCERRFKEAYNICLPFILERLENTRRSRADPSHPWEAPKDGLQWIIEESYATKDPAQLDPVRVCRRLLYVNDISLHSTSYTVQNLILDLYNFEDSGELVEALRQEAKTVLEEAGGSWTREAVQKLKLVDATIRESMRLTPFASIGLPRTVVKDEGITMASPKGDVHIPRGTVLAVPMDPIHRDESIYPDANTFNPYRFLRPDGIRGIFDQIDAKHGGGATSPPQQTDGSKVKSSVTLDDAFLGFGFGKHACPGRFFALNEMKVFVAHMVLHYDIECLDRRPELTNVIWLKVPYNDGRVRVRKRQAS
ncbi:cytochrome P450 [Stachybotrys elegans]|uniref:Cytochrome P450 n=1 Tax=Stachybotrys elegans TaxID=80388 RepID=A0A8K0SNX2_9HYPO|nr:cytochrome P450 [Stachybotrys elegans]